MSNTSFCNFNYRSDGQRSDFSTNKLKYSSYYSTSEPCGDDSAPRILREFIRPPARFRQSFASPVFAKSSFFSAKPNLSSLIRGGVYDASSDFGRLSQNPVGQQLKTFTDSALYIDYFMESARVLYLRTSFLQRVRKYRTKHFPCCNLFILYLLRFFNPNQIFTLH